MNNSNKSKLELEYSGIHKYSECYPQQTGI